MSVDTSTDAQTQHANVTINYPIDGLSFKVLIEASLNWLRTNQQIVNSLNVFPVPDGDTGTNMVLTMQAAFDEITNLPERNFGKMAHAVAHGALMGARGNSGVILSQIWRGFARSVDHIEQLNAETFAKAFAAARDTAYKGVVRPVEGTILTVIKDVASAAEIAMKHTDDPLVMLEEIVEAADQSVQKTPDLLPVLKEAGVVDSGGKGLFFILEGMLRYSKGLPLDVMTASVQPLASMQLDNTMATIEPGQDYEVVVDFKPDTPLNLEEFYHHLEELGTSIQLGEGDGIYRMHIHVPTEKRYLPIDYTMSLGTITKVAIENLMVQMEEMGGTEGGGKLNLSPVEAGQIGVIAVSPGLGISRVFASLGVSAIVEGGQSMNPSIQEIIKSIENLPTDQIVILPNNKNIIAAADAAVACTVKKAIVIPTKSIPQGFAAMLRLTPDGDLDEVTSQMNTALTDVITGEITRATRSVEIDGVTVQEGEFIALLNGKLILSANNIEEACLSLLSQAKAKDFELITLFYGKEMPKSEVNRIADLIRAKFPDQEIEVQDGGQPHYYFIISIE
ncbi:MAG: DAK2 domain-containing protein [Anaerolineales bacterium]|nr:DAK2 domain-containing protein [Anaerolineales bacterium]